MLMFILTGEVTAAKESLLQGQKYDDALLHFADYADVNADDMLPETTFNLRRNSPFAVFFRRAIETHGNTPDSSSESGVAVANAVYSPACFKAMSDVMAYFPLWSCVVQSPVVSNSPVESHFKQLKQITLRKRTRLRPAEVVQSELTYVRANLNSAWLADNQTTDTSQQKEITTIVIVFFSNSYFSIHTKPRRTLVG